MREHIALHTLQSVLNYECPCRTSILFRMAAAKLVLQGLFMSLGVPASLSDIRLFSVHNSQSHHLPSCYQTSFIPYNGIENNIMAKLYMFYTSER